jgi:hypothetical protein
MNVLEAQSREVGLMSKLTVGLDVGDRFSQVCAVDADGVLVQEGRVATTREALPGAATSAAELPGDS